MNTMHPAWAMNGIPDAGDDTTTSTRGTTFANAKVLCMAMHPSLPRVAYLEEWDEEVKELESPSPSFKRITASSKSSKATFTTTNTTRKRSRLVVREYSHIRSRDAVVVAIDDNNSDDSNLTLASMSMDKLTLHIDQYRSSRRKGGTRSLSQKINDQSSSSLPSVGILTSLTFLDSNAMHWETRRGRGAVSDMDLTVTIDEEMEDGIISTANDIRLDVDDDIAASVIATAPSSTFTMGRGLCLGLQFTRALVLLRLAERGAKCTILCCLEGQRSSSSASSGGAKNAAAVAGGGGQWIPTSAPLAISTSVFVYGCSDGAMRFHDLAPSSKLSTTGRNSSSSGGRQSTIKSVRGPNGRSDPVVAILNIDPVYDFNNNDERRKSTIPSPKALDSNTMPSLLDNNTLLLCSRILTVCGSGVAFVWDVHVSIDRSTGTICDLTVLPPLVRLDGLGNMTVSPRDIPSAASPISPKSPGSSSSSGFWGVAAEARSKGGGISAEAPYSKVAPIISHDPHRNLLTWTLPPDAPALSINHASGDRHELQSKPSPTLSSPNAGEAGDDSVFLSNWAKSNGGFVKVWDLALINDYLKPNAPQSSSPRPPPRVPPIVIMKLPATVTSIAITGLPHPQFDAASLICINFSKFGSRMLIHSAPLPDAIYDADDGKEDGESSSSSISPVVQGKVKKLGAERGNIVHVNFMLSHTVPLANSAKNTAIYASHLTPDVVLVVTDRGIVTVDIANDKSWTSSDSSSGNGGEFSMRNVRYYSGPNHTVISLPGVGNRPGILSVEDCVVYLSQLRTISSNDQKPALIKKVDFHNKRLASKLRGKLAWRTIRSTPTSTFVEYLRPMKSPPRLIPSPSGRYLCLYWESGRSYSILHAGSLLAREQTNNQLRPATTPSVDSGTNVSSFAWFGDDDNFALIRQLHTTPSTNSIANDGDSTAPFPSSRKQSRPQVELYKLAEVKIDAVELAAGASVAAATAVSLGPLAVRGGERFIPTSLFGGPALCIGCRSTSDRALFGDDVAYFYSQKGDSSTYVTIGTSVPYPDLLIWDEIGKLCAISIGTRVVVYLSNKSRFILLGSVQVIGSHSSDVEETLLSMKFIHGVLYCSTESSVHAIFLGDIEDENVVCEMDVFTIATNSVPLYGTDNPDISSPVPIVAALTLPHVLAYHSGGLLVSTTSGLRLLSLSHPTIRIGTLLAANLIDKARKWIVAMPKSNHDNLAHFLIRRGHVGAISELNGLSLETYIDLCIRYERTDELVHLLGKHGSEIIAETCEWGRDCGYSAFFLLGVYMLGKDKIECAKDMITKATVLGISELLVDAMKLATMVSVADETEGSALLLKVNEAMDLNNNRSLSLINVL